MPIKLNKVHFEMKKGKENGNGKDQQSAHMVSTNYIDNQREDSDAEKFYLFLLFWVNFLF